MISTKLLFVFFGCRIAWGISTLLKYTEMIANQKAKLYLYTKDSQANSLVIYHVSLHFIGKDADE